MRPAAFALVVLACSRPVVAPRPAPIEVAVTFDDLPAAGPDIPELSRLQVHREIVAALRKHGVPQVYAFVNGKGAELPDGRAALDAWVAAGYPLGNHTYSHSTPKELPNYLRTFIGMSRCYASSFLDPRSAGSVRWISFDEAQRDPVYRSDPEVAPTGGDILQEQVATARGTRVIPWVTMPLQQLSSACR